MQIGLSCVRIKNQDQPRESPWRACCPLQSCDQ
uniref:Uncharacterized protein n=1 Tax=Rhizophora mucronata TaxID=61149 RepID=A0A2P2NNA3_RHIMU